MKGYLLLGILLAATALMAQSPFTVVEMSDTEIVLQFEMPNWELVDGDAGQNISAPDGLLMSEEGKPQLPYFAEMLGLPLDGSFTVEATDIKRKTHRGVDLAPVGTILVDDGEPRLTMKRDRRAYSVDALYPARMLSQSEPAFLADRRFAGFQFYPFQYNASRKTLTVATKATIRIRIHGDTRETRGWQAIASMTNDSGGVFLNNEHSRKWRRRPQQTTNATQSRSSLVDEIQFFIDEDGIYKITYAALTDSISSWEDSLDYTMSWRPSQIDPRNLEMSSPTGPIPIYFHGETDGSFDPGDYFEFYGERHAGEESYYDTYTSENVYTLRLNSSPGARMAVENGGLEINDPSLYTVPRAYEQTKHVEEQNLVARLGFLPTAPREDIWFWGLITAPSMEIVDFNLQYPYQSPLRGFTADVMLVGSSHLDTLASNVNDHHAEVRLNSAIIGNKEWKRQREQLFTNEEFLENTHLNHGDNSLYISLPGDIPTGYEQVLLDYLDLKYWREYKTDEDYIEFTKPSNRENGLFQFELDNFSASDISIYKIGASILENLQIEPFSETGGAPWRVTFQDQVYSNDTRYYAVTEAQKKHPRRMGMNIPSELKTIDHQANYIIITGQKFFGCEGLEDYEQIWEQYGQQFTGSQVNVEVVAVEDIFDEFNGGVRSDDAIRDFLEFAYNNWNYGGTTGRIQNVLLLGEGMLDERDDSPWRDNNIIPVHYVWTYKYGATPADNWYTAVAGTDPVGDINIGRICLWNEEQIQTVANKLRHYIEDPDGRGLWHGEITFAAGGDSDDGTDIFAQQSETIREYSVPAAYNVNRVYTYTQTVSPYFQGNTYTLLDLIASGTSYIQFMGHGGGQVWADNGLLDYDHISAMTNDRYPMISSLACYCSAFDTYGDGCLGEAIVLAEESGAIGHLGFSGMGYLTHDLEYGLFFNEALFDDEYVSVGDALTITKAQVYANMSGSPQTALLQGSAYLGDPAVKLHLPAGVVDVTLDDYNVGEGEAITVQAQFPSDVTMAKMIVVNEDDVTLNSPYATPIAGGVFQQSYVVPDIGGGPYAHTIKVFGGSDDDMSAASAEFTVGMTAVRDVTTSPEVPLAADSVLVSARFFDDDGIALVTCNWNATGGSSGTIGMHYDAELDKYVLDEPLRPFSPGFLVYWTFRITDNNGEVTQTEEFRYYVAGPDLRIISVLRDVEDSMPVLKVFMENVGNVDSPEFSMELYKMLGDGQRPVLLYSGTMPSAPALTQVWHSIPLPLITGAIGLKLIVNRNHDFLEVEYTKNEWIANYSFNYAAISPGADQMTSVDGNLTCVFPAEALPAGSIAFIDRAEDYVALNQPDVSFIDLDNGEASPTYEVGLLDSTLYADSLGLLPGGSTMQLRFCFNVPDSIDSWSDDDTFGVYRWNDTYQKWIFQGGQISRSEHLIVKNVNRCGVYTVFRNEDQAAPNIDANVEEQEFSHGGYVSGEGVISFILSDDNGVDVVDHPPLLYLDGQEIPLESIHSSASLGMLTNVPIKYQLDLGKGSYTLIVSCSDVNGNYSEKYIPFIVNTEFDIINLANYPNPVKSVTIEPVNEGRTRFTYVLTDDADKVELKIYTVNGRLVKSFYNLPTAVGYHEYPRTVYGWDCRDNDGKFLANGVYFYRLTATRGGKKVEKIQKLAVLR